MPGNQFPGTAGGHLYSTLFLHYGAATCLVGEGCQSSISAVDRFILTMTKSRVDDLLQEEEIEAIEAVTGNCVSLVSMKTTGGWSWPRGCQSSRNIWTMLSGTKWDF